MAAFVRQGGRQLAGYDFTRHRLHVEGDLAAGISVPLGREAASYLASVLRLPTGAEILAFNGRDGEWLGRLEVRGKRDATLLVLSRTREQEPPLLVDLLFAPLKHARLDYMVQKAVEMGAGTLRPVITRRTVASRLNLDRMRANVIEAAEQCGILSVPAVLPPAPLPSALATLSPDRPLIFCDEDAAVGSPASALAGLSAADGYAVLIGPEGGFDPSERELLLRRGAVRRLSLGPRILRADTAAVAALATVQAVIAVA